MEMNVIVANNGEELSNPRQRALHLLTNNVIELLVSAPSIETAFGALMGAFATIANANPNKLRAASSAATTLVLMLDKLANAAESGASPKEAAHAVQAPAFKDQSAKERFDRTMALGHKVAYVLNVSAEHHRIQMGALFSVLGTAVLQNLCCADQSIQTCKDLIRDIELARTAGTSSAKVH